MTGFRDIFGAEPAVVASAPGRVNLLGEHTDYNEGYVLPMALPMRLHVALGRGASRECRVYSSELGAICAFRLEEPPREQFAKYVYGCICGLHKLGTPVPPVDLHIRSEVPIGSGLSSSAALEVATLRALRDFLQIDLNDVAIAQLAHAAEQQHAGVNCGIMDQMASSLAPANRLLFLDTRTLERKVMPMPQGAEIAVIDSGIKRTLATSGYNTRRSECETAARLLHVRALRDVESLAQLDALPAPLDRRARHVVTENRRVIAAARQPDAATFGILMNASHDSLRDDFQVSLPELDLLVDVLRNCSGVYGARLTGAGFGGACIALCREGAARQIATTAVSDYRRMGHVGSVLFPKIRANEAA